MDITLTNVSYKYGSNMALDSVSCSFSSGDMVAILGQNGSGKSTLLRCINRVVIPYKGSIRYDDRLQANMTMRQIAEIIAYVPQNCEGDGYSTVFDSVLLGRRPYMNGMPTKSDYLKVADAIVRMNLEELAMRPLNTLSGGECQRVMVARALAQHPAVILLDEPIASLDVKHQLMVMNTLSRLSAGGVMVIVTIHDIAMAVRYCNKTIMLKEGTLFACGGRELYTSDNIRKLYDIDDELYKNWEYGTDEILADSLCGKRL